MKVQRAVGIDLGTTNSAIALFLPDGSDVVLFEDKFKRKTVPSMVGWNPGTEAMITGYDAWHRRAMEPAPVASIKRKMGSQSTVPVGPKHLLPEEISAKILASLSTDMRSFLQGRLEDLEISFNEAVITVPAYFDAPQIEATRRAGELAGLQVVGLLQEPTAAAIYYAWKHGIGDGTFLVYDLGGGTFDVSVIRSMLGEYQVLGIHGDNYLGGDDFDRRLAEYFRVHLVEQGYALDLDIANNSDDAVRFLLLVRLAQEVKEALSTSEFQYIGRRDIFEDQNGQSVTLELEFARSDFEKLIEEFVDQTIACCHEALKLSAEQGEVTLSDIDHVLLVGGSTRVPLVQQKIAAALCGPGKSQAERPLLDEPDTCVALGAAIHAGNVAAIKLFPTPDESGDEVKSTANLVELSTSLGTSQSTGYLAGTLRGAHVDHIKSAVLVNPAGDIAAIVRVEAEDDEIAFAFDTIELPDEGRYDYSLEFCDAEGDARLTYPIWLRRLSPEAAFRPTGSALSNPSVLAKDISLEIARDGKAARQVLLPRGTSLPADGQYRFYTADRSGAVILRLFQSRFPIRTLHLEVPDSTEVGTPVELTITVDESMTMVASGELQGQTFWAQIEPPPARELKNWEQIEALLEGVETVTRQLWGQEARIFESATAPLVTGIRETARTDPDKLQVLAARLENAIEDYHQRDTDLTPGYGRMVTLLDAIKRVVFRGDGDRHLGHSSDEWQARIAAMETEADEAFSAHDQATWTRVFNRVQAIWESLAQDEFRFRMADTAEHVRALFVALASSLEDLRSNLDNFPFAANPETRALQEREIEGLRLALEQRVGTPLSHIDLQAIDPSVAKPQLDRLFEAASHIRHQLEKLPTLGLVRK